MPKKHQMPARVVLLTFEGLPVPFAQQSGSQDSDSSAYDELAACSTVFENYYLQRQGGTFAEGEHGRNEDAAEQLTTAFPDADQIIRIHEDCRIRTEHAKFRSAVERAKNLLTSPLDSLIVTAINGRTDEDNAEFDTLLCESRIRVPLWICRSGQEPERIQRITGSSELPDIMAALLRRNDDSSTATTLPQEFANRERRDDTPERILRIDCDNAIGFRSEQFFFVRRDVSPEQSIDVYAEQQSALYAKPEDVWNVNDVSAEYIDVVERFEAMT